MKSLENPNSQLRTGGPPAVDGHSRAGLGFRKSVFAKRTKGQAGCGRADCNDRRAHAGSSWVNIICFGWLFVAKGS